MGEKSRESVREMERKSRETKKQLAGSMDLNFF